MWIWRFALFPTLGPGILAESSIVSNWREELNFYGFPAIRLGWDFLCESTTSFSNPKCVFLPPRTNEAQFTSYELEKIEAYDKANWDFFLKSDVSCLTGRPAGQMRSSLSWKLTDCSTLCATLRWRWSLARSKQGTCCFSRFAGREFNARVLQQRGKCFLARSKNEWKVKTIFSETGNVKLPRETFIARLSGYEITIRIKAHLFVHGATIFWETKILPHNAQSFEMTALLYLPL